jgi:Etoposide-induced protein 2.4 (EI24)
MAETPLVSSSVWPGLLGALWRAALSCLHPRVIWLVTWPLLVSVLVVSLVGWWLWQPLTALLQEGLSTWTWLAQWWRSLQGWLGLPAVDPDALAATLAPMLLMLAAVPILVASTLLVVSLVLGPALTRWVAQRRSPALLPQDETPWWQSLAWTLGVTGQALVWLVLSLPLWWIPILGGLVPAVIWGWLASKVMAHDALVDHATALERRQMLTELRWPLLTLGLLAAGLGAAPSHLVMMGALATGMVSGLAGGALAGPMGGLAAITAPLVIAGIVWFYTLLFAFASLTFAHYLLPELARRRGLPNLSSSLPPNQDWRHLS